MPVAYAFRVVCLNTCHRHTVAILLCQACHQRKFLNDFEKQNPHPRIFCSYVFEMRRTSSPRECDSTERTTNSKSGVFTLVGILPLPTLLSFTGRFPDLCLRRKASNQPRRLACVIGRYSCKTERACSAFWGANRNKNYSAVSAVSRCCGFVTTRPKRPTNVRVLRDGISLDNRIVITLSLRRLPLENSSPQPRCVESIRRCQIAVARFFPEEK